MAIDQSFKDSADPGQQLFKAAAKGNVARVRQTLEAGAKLHEKKNKISPLRAAMQSGNADCVSAVLDAGADPGVKGAFENGEITDHDFSKNCDPSIAALVDAAYQKFRLIEAAGDGDAKTVTELLAKGEPFDVFNEMGATALSSAATKGNAGIIRILLDHGADPNQMTKYLQTPLGLAVSSGNAESVAALLDAGAVRGVAALHEAVGKRFTEIARLLLADGADPNLTARDTKILAEPSDFFISAVLHMNADDFPFHTAVRNQDIPTMRVLAAGGASVVTTDAKGRKVLQLAQESGNPEIWEIVRTRHEQEIETLAASTVQLDGDTTPLKALKFKPKGPG